MAVNPPQDPLARERARRIRRQQIQRRRLVLAVLVLALIILVVALAVGLSGRSDETTGTTTGTGDGSTTTTSLGAATFTAQLTGANSVPAVETESTGALTLEYDPNALTLSFSLNLSGLSNPSSAAIYEGTAGTNGTVIYVLFAGPTKTGTGYEGELASGTVEAGNLQGSLKDGTIGDLIALIQAGNAYVSVGNTSHPVDAIRGTIQ
jgi:hypothetical protein